MKIVSTTLTGNNEEIIAEALRSVVQWVDACLVIDTGVADSTLKVAREVTGEKLIVRRFDWVDDFAIARNFALDVATELAFDWAITLDTDERIELHGEDLRAMLHRMDEGILMMLDAGGNYAKERVFRLPCAVRYDGPTHEAIPSYKVGTRVAERARFSELPKDTEQARGKFERDVAMLTKHIRHQPEDPRWHYYLGESLYNLRRFDEAISAYAKCTALRGWDEESAWACFRAAQCQEELGRWQDMVDALALGMGRHAGLAELPWYAGYAYLKMGNHRQAVYWSHLAITWGYFAGHGKGVPRIGFRHLPALFEGPFDVLRFAYAEIGEAERAQEAEKAYHKAKAARRASHT